MLGQGAVRVRAGIPSLLDVFASQTTLQSVEIIQYYNSKTTKSLDVLGQGAVRVWAGIPSLLSGSASQMTLLSKEINKTIYRV